MFHSPDDWIALALVIGGWVTLGYVIGYVIGWRIGLNKGYQTGAREADEHTEKLASVIAIRKMKQNASDLVEITSYRGIGSRN